jgi:hypothetical protein
MCGAEVIIKSSGSCTNWYEPVNSLLDAEYHNIPFYCDTCGAIRSPFKAIRDIAFIFPFSEQTTYGEGIVQIPDSYQKFYKKGKGVLLSIGPGYYTSKGFRSVNQDLNVGCVVKFDSSVPWVLPVIGTDGKEYPIVVCGEKDIWWIEG